MPLRLAKYGVPLAETAPAGLAAAGIEPALLPPTPEQAGQPELPSGAGRRPVPREAIAGEPAALPVEETADAWQEPQAEEGPEAAGPHESPWFAASQAAQDAYQGTYDPTYVEGFEPVPVTVPAGPGVPVPAGPGGRTRPLGTGPDPQAFDEQYAQGYEEQQAQPVPEPEPPAEFTPEDKEFEELAYPAYKDYVDEHQGYPNARTLDILLADRYGVHHPNSTALLKRLMPGFQKRHQADLEAEHIA